MVAGTPLLDVYKRFQGRHMDDVRSGKGRTRNARALRLKLRLSFWHLLPVRRRQEA